MIDITPGFIPVSPMDAVPYEDSDIRVQKTFTEKVKAAMKDAAFAALSSKDSRKILAEMAKGNFAGAMIIAKKAGVSLALSAVM